MKAGSGRPYIKAVLRSTAALTYATKPRSVTLRPPPQEPAGFDKDTDSEEKIC